MAWLFTPPSEPDVPTIAVDPVDERHPLGNRLMRYFGPPGPRGRNVWQLTPDTAPTFTFYDPWPLVDNTGANRDTLHPPDGDAYPQAVGYERVYYGGHEHLIENFIVAFALAVFLVQNDYDANDWIVLV